MRRALLDFIDRPRCATLAVISMQRVLACGILLEIGGTVGVLFAAMLARKQPTPASDQIRRVRRAWGHAVDPVSGRSSDCDAGASSDVGGGGEEAGGGGD